MKNQYDSNKEKSVKNTHKLIKIHFKIFTDIQKSTPKTSLHRS